MKRCRQTRTGMIPGLTLCSRCSAGTASASHDLKSVCSAARSVGGGFYVASTNDSHAAVVMTLLRPLMLSPARCGLTRYAVGPACRRDVARVQRIRDLPQRPGAWRNFGPPSCTPHSLAAASAAFLRKSGRALSQRVPPKRCSRRLRPSLVPSLARTALPPPGLAALRGAGQGADQWPCATQWVPSGALDCHKRPSAVSKIASKAAKRVLYRSV
jgi:hypothetical protein